MFPLSERSLVKSHCNVILKQPHQADCGISLRDVVLHFGVSTGCYISGMSGIIFLIGILWVVYIL